MLEDIVEPILHRPQIARNASLMLGYAGASVIMATYRAAEKFNLDPRDIFSRIRWEANGWRARRYDC